jgi:hypothetical protein
VPLGYVVKDRKLVVNEAEADTVRMIFQRFARLGSATKLARELVGEQVTTKRGAPVDKGYIYKVLNNRVYVGEAVHKGTAYPGEHQAIVERALWDRVHDLLRESPRKRAAHSRAQTPALLKGLLFGPGGTAMTPTHTRRKGTLYRYYISTAILRRGARAGPVDRLPAAEIEAAVVGEIRRLLRAPEIVAPTWKAGRKSIPDLTAEEVRDAIEHFEELWEELFPAEQARIVQLLVQRVDVGLDGADICLRTEGLVDLVADLRDKGPEGQRAA